LTNKFSSFILPDWNIHSHIHHPIAQKYRNYRLPSTQNYAANHLQVSQTTPFPTNE